MGCLRRAVVGALILALALPLHAAIPGDGARLRVCADPYNPPLSDDREGGFENRIAELLAKELGVPLEYTWFPQRRGFIRNTLRAELRDGVYKCDVVMGVPTAYEQTATTAPYYASTWVLVYARGRGFDLDRPEAVDALPAEQREQIRAGVFDLGPGQIWVYKHGLMEHAVPYVAQPGDASVSPVETMIRDIVADKIDMGFVWGPIGGFFVRQQESALVLLSMTESDPQLPEMKFHYNISMGVRHADKAWKQRLNRFITERRQQIEAILNDHGVPLVPVSAVTGGDDDD